MEALQVVIVKFYLNLNVKFRLDLSTSLDFILMGFYSFIGNYNFKYNFKNSFGYVMLCYVTGLQGSIMGL